MKRALAIVLALATPAAAEIVPAPVRARAHTPSLLVVPTLAQVFGPSSVPGGSTGQVQYNNAGAFGGVTGFTLSAGTLSAITVRTTFGSTPDAADTIDLGETAGQITFEGSAADGFETRFTATNPTGGDQLYKLPDIGAPVTRTLALKDQDNLYSSVQTMLNNQEFRVGTSALGEIVGDTTMTPDSAVILPSSTSNAWHMFEIADIAFDFQNCVAGASAAADPLLCIHSRSQSTTQWIDFRHDTSDGTIDTGLGFLRFAPAASGIKVTGTAPTVSACGTSPTTVTGSSTAGRLTTGSGGTVQSCTLTFATAWSTAPSCGCNDETTILLVRAIATTTTLICDSAAAGSLASQVLTYRCIGGN